MKISNFWIKNMLCFSACFVYLNTSFARPFKDLSPFESVDLDVDVQSVSEIDGTNSAFYSVKSEYTNTVVCDLEVTVPILKDDKEMTATVHISEVLIFPLAAFDKPLSYSVEQAKLPQGATVLSDRVLSLKKSATCHGWNMERRLPARTCNFLNPEHIQTCGYAKQAGKDHYPLVKKNQYLGNCGCL